MAKKFYFCLVDDVKATEKQTGFTSSYSYCCSTGHPPDRRVTQIVRFYCILQVIIPEVPVIQYACLKSSMLLFHNLYFLTYLIVISSIL